jgi:hypothetical protein
MATSPSRRARCGSSRPSSRRPRTKGAWVPVPSAARGLTRRPPEARIDLRWRREQPGIGDACGRSSWARRLACCLGSSSVSRLAFHLRRKLGYCSGDWSAGSRRLDYVARPPPPFRKRCGFAPARTLISLQANHSDSGKILRLGPPAECFSRRAGESSVWIASQKTGVTRFRSGFAELCRASRHRPRRPTRALEEVDEIDMPNHLRPPLTL